MVDTEQESAMKLCISKISVIESAYDFPLSWPGEPGLQANEGLRAGGEEKERIVLV